MFIMTCEDFEDYQVLSAVKVDEDEADFIMTCEDFDDYQVLSAVKVDDAFDDDLPF